MWLYVPPRCLLVPEDSTSPSSSPSPEPRPFCTSSGTAIQRPLSWRGWKTRAWIKLLSGMTLPPSMADLGVASWISSWVAFPASPTQSPESDSATTTTAPSGPSSPGSWVNVAPPWSSSRTSQTSFLEESSDHLAKNYADWVTRSKIRSSLLRKTLARVTGGRECSCLPTPSAVSYGSNRGGGEGRVGKIRHSLESLARMGELPGHPAGCLNPEWIEQAMGWPVGWTGFGVVEMESWLSRQQSLLESFFAGPVPTERDLAR